MRTDIIDVKHTKKTTHVTETEHYIVVDDVDSPTDSYKVTHKESGTLQFIPRDHARELLVALLDITGGVGVEEVK